MYWGCTTIITGAKGAQTPRDRGFASRLDRQDAVTFFKGCLFVLCCACGIANAAAIKPFTDDPTAQCVPPAAHVVPEPAPAPAPKLDKRLVIIIDDLGHNLHRGQQAVDLPGKITYAVIPFTPHASELARAAHVAGKEVMLHAPMSTIRFNPLGSGGLTPDQSRREFQEILKASLQDVPFVKGVNNHMGSDLTQRHQQMGWLMRELLWQGMYFVDSRTSGRSVAASVASEYNVPNLSRQVFLDHVATEEEVATRFAELLSIVDRTGLAVAIGHPYRTTLNYLREVLPQLPGMGIELVLVSEALGEAGDIDQGVAAAEHRFEELPDC